MPEDLLIQTRTTTPSMEPSAASPTDLAQRAYSALEHAVFGILEKTPIVQTLAELDATGDLARSVKNNVLKNITISGLNAEQKLDDIEERTQYKKRLISQGVNPEAADERARWMATQAETRGVIDLAVGFVQPVGEAGKLVPKVGETLTAKILKTGEEVTGKVLKIAKMPSGAVMAQLRQAGGRTRWVPVSKYAEWSKPITKGVSQMPKELEPLAEGARKYKGKGVRPEAGAISKAKETAQISAQISGRVEASEATEQALKHLQGRAEEIQALVAGEKTSIPPERETSVLTGVGRIPPLGRGTGSSGFEESRSFENIIKESEVDVKTKVNWLDQWRTPEYVLQKIGLGKQAEILRRAYDAYRQELGQEIKRIIDWMQRVPGKDAAQKIFRYLDGQEATLNDAERQVAEEIKDYLKKWADRLGLPEDRRIAHYITHIFEKGFIRKEFDPDLAKIISYRIPGSVYDPFLEQRLGKLGYREDVWAALDAYVKRATRKANMDPALQELREAAKDLPLESYRYVRDLAQRINLRPTETDNLIDNLLKASPIGYRFTQRPTAYLTRLLREAVYRGGLGLNFGAAFKNLSQGTNTYAKLGEKYTYYGYAEFLPKLLRGELDELQKLGILKDDIIQDRYIGAVRGLLQKLDAVLWSVFDTAEKINRGAAYFGAKRMAIDRGLTEAGAIEFAKKMVRETQFTFGSIDTPVMLSSDLMKLLAQFQTYNIKQAEFLGNMIKNRELGGLFRWIGANLVILGTIGKLWGMRPRDLIPTVRIGGSPFLNVVNAFMDLMYGGEEKQRQASRELRRLVALIVPGGVQLRKTYLGLRDYITGEALDKRGKTKYEIEQDLANFLRATLFGPYAFPEAQKYFEERGKPKQRSIWDDVPTPRTKKSIWD